MGDDLVDVKQLMTNYMATVLGGHWDKRLGNVDTGLQSMNCIAAGENLIFKFCVPRKAFVKGRHNSQSAI